MKINVAIFAYNEEGRIAASLNSLPLDDDRFRFFVLVNGTTDRTVPIAQAIADKHDNLSVVEYERGGKARTWNRYIYEVCDQDADAYIFMDGDAEIMAGSFDAMVALSLENPQVNSVSGLPRNGRRVAHYQNIMRTEGGLFGDLYLLSASFVTRFREAELWLPGDIVSDDGLIHAMAATDLGLEDQWDRTRTMICEDSGFYAETVDYWNLAHMRMQFKRMVRYRIRDYQNAIITRILQTTGPKGLPKDMWDIYSQHEDKLKLRFTGIFTLFDMLALKQIHREGRAAAIKQQQTPSTGQAV